MAGGMAAMTARGRNVGAAVAPTPTRPVPPATAPAAARPTGPSILELGPTATIPSSPPATWPPILADACGRVGRAAALGPEGGRLATSWRVP
jgi:hypothetical protein